MERKTVCPGLFIGVVADPDAAAAYGFDNAPDLHARRPFEQAAKRSLPALSRCDRKESSKGYFLFLAAFGFCPFAPGCRPLRRCCYFS